VADHGTVRPLRGVRMRDGSGRRMAVVWAPEDTAELARALQGHGEPAAAVDSPGCEAGHCGDPACQLDCGDPR